MSVERSDRHTHLNFFGTVMASISHELKNALAIMGENGGLLIDLLAMAEQRRQPLDPTRVAAIAERIQRNAGRADDIVKNMNRVSHTIDHEQSTVVVDEMLNLLIAIAQRKASQAGVEITALPGDEGLELNTNPFFMLEALWRCALCMMDVTVPESAIEIQPVAAPERISIVFSASLSAPLVVADEVKMVVDMIGGEVELEGPAPAVLVVHLPRTVRQRPGGDDGPLATGTTAEGGSHE